MSQLDLFTAKFYGSCPLCCEAIVPGDWVGYVDDEVVCEQCFEEEIAFQDASNLGWLPDY